MYQSMYLIQILRLKYTNDLKDGYIDDFEDQNRLIGWENWILIYCTCSLRYWILWYGLNVWCSRWLYWDYDLRDHYIYILSTDDEIFIDSKWDCMVRNQCSDMLLYYFILLKITEKVLLDCNSIYSFCLLYTRLLLLFTVIVTVYCVYYYCLLYCYCHCIIPVI